MGERTGNGDALGYGRGHGGVVCGEGTGGDMGGVVAAMVGAMGVPVGHGGAWRWGATGIWLCMAAQDVCGCTHDLGLAMHDTWLGRTWHSCVLRCYGGFEGGAPGSGVRLAWLEGLGRRRAWWGLG